MISQETFIRARGTIKSVVEAKVDIRRLRLDPRVVMDIAFAAAGRGHGMTQWLEQTSHRRRFGSILCTMADLRADDLERLYGAELRQPPISDAKTAGMMLQSLTERHPSRRTSLQAVRTWRNKHLRDSAHRIGSCDELEADAARLEKAKAELSKEAARWRGEAARLEKANDEVAEELSRVKEEEVTQ